MGGDLGDERVRSEPDGGGSSSEGLDVCRKEGERELVELRKKMKRIGSSHSLGSKPSRSG